MAALGLALGVVCLSLVFTQETSIVPTFVTNTPVIDQSRDLTLRCSVSAPHTYVALIDIRMNNNGRYIEADTYRYTEFPRGNITLPEMTREKFDNGSAFLQVTWKNPGPDQTGFYNCSVLAKDTNSNRGLRWSWKGLTIS